MNNIPYRHVDVFAPRPLSGNGLAVFPQAGGLSAVLMLRLTQELRQFESIFLTPTAEQDVFNARVFTVDEELPFAGHPILGAGAVLHEAQAPNHDAAAFFLILPAGRVRIDSRRTGQGAYRVAMEQGHPTFDRTLSAGEEVPILDALTLEPKHRDPDLPLEVVSTGLAYLIVPVTPEGLARAQIRSADFENLLAEIGAKFVYVFDAEKREGRTWDNAGTVEDIATGSAAGPAGAYLIRHGAAEAGDVLLLQQGRFLDRPSEMRVEVTHSLSSPSPVIVAGDVQMVGTGVIDATFSDMDA
ncbi:PhzF family phenazine biosynthesis protein [Salinisphaera sp. LB1]|uniref:PhzF family phenazine biosynthesis protein n=1 Tax=Salinisphaera sp. LB1 TaxID=2183911 RepID=UPI000D707B79|nr:PhzF family phenazine biosynthesis protein [Salinisphaera sp. LB1]AWN16841.1 Phenazine biosynthesis protein PhzF like [Salinisphaera sp. LB1]